MFSARVARTLATTAPVQKKVAVLGAAGGIGQPLALLLKVFLSFFFEVFTPVFSATKPLLVSHATMSTPSLQVSAPTCPTLTPRPPSLPLSVMMSRPPLPVATLSSSQLVSHASQA